VAACPEGLLPALLPASRFFPRLLHPQQGSDMSPSLPAAGQL